jgi:hypothetical protein
MYCVFLGKAVQTVTPASGSVTNDMISYPLAKSGAAVSTFNRTTSDGTILELQKDGTTVGNIGAFSGNTVIGTDDTGLRFNPGGSSDNITPFNVSSYANRSNAISLGHPSITFKDLYLGGGAYIGGTGTANYLDDYEEGTWTPVFRGSSGSAGSSTTTFTGARYTKIGRLVFATVAFLRWSDRGSYSGDVQIEGLPFTANSTTTKVTGSVAWVKRIQFEGADENDYQVVVEGGTDYMQFYRQTSDLGTAFELTTTAFDDILNSLHISVTYETDA